MSIGIIISLFVAFLAVVSGQLGGKAKLGAVGASWLALVGGVAAAAFGELLPADVAALAVMGAIAVQPIHGLEPSRGLMAAGGFAGVVGAALIYVGGGDPVGGANTALLLGLWAALSGALGLFASNAFDDDHDHQIGVGLAVCAAMAGALFMAASRNVLGEFGYYLYLGTEAGRLYWELPGVERLPDGVRLSVAASLSSWVVIVLAIGAGSALIAAVLSLKKMTKLRSYAWGASLVCSVAVLFAVLSAEATSIPGPERYGEFARQMLLKAQASESSLSIGDFSSDFAPTVHKPSLVPDIVFLGLAAFWSFLGLMGAVRREPIEEFVLRQQESLLRATGLLWLTWFLAALYHVQILGTPGMRSAGEWMSTGLVLFVTGVVAIAFDKRRSIQWGPSLVSGIAVAGVVVLAAIAVSFGAFPWISLSMY